MCGAPSRILIISSPSIWPHCSGGGSIYSEGSRGLRASPARPATLPAPPALERADDARIGSRRPTDGSRVDLPWHVGIRSASAQPSNRGGHMATKRGFRVRMSTPNARCLGSAPRRSRTAIALAAATATCMLAAAPALANTGSVYFDNTGNAGAGGDLFQTIFEGGARNVGLGATVFPNLTVGDDNIAVGDQALVENGNGSDNIAIGSKTLSTTVTNAN